MLFTFFLVMLFVSYALLMKYFIYTLRFKRTQINHRSLSDKEYPMVSILKPVKNPDSSFEQNITTFYQTDYPCFEIIFGLETEQDKALPIIKRVCEKYPDVSTKIVFTGTDKIGNPKVDNLKKMERVADGSLYWIADANVQVEPVVLRKIVFEQQMENSSLVFCPILGSGSQTLGAAIENLHLSYFVSGNIITAWQLCKRQVTVGKSMLVERASLEKHFNGFGYFQDFLAEDFIMADHFQKAGLKISSNFTWVKNINKKRSIFDFYSRMARWCILRFHMVRSIYITEVLFLNPLITALVALLMIGKSALPLLFFTLFFKTGLEYLNMILLNKEDRKKVWIHLLFPFLIIYKDIVLFFSYLTPIFTSSVNWRGRIIAVGKETRIIEDEEYCFQEHATQ